jgi:hypothetical protein
LAARNILLGHEFTVKVGDFGLARDVYKYQAYMKNSTVGYFLTGLGTNDVNRKI